MQMHLEPKTRAAFELVHDAQAELREFRRGGDLSRLETARRKLRNALDVDPACLRAHYYDAVASDLSGQMGDAVKGFQLVLGAVTGEPAGTAQITVTPPHSVPSAFIHEVRYNLGVALYHHYSWTYLDQAIRQFDNVIASSPDRRLKWLAQAGRAQAYAMHMIPPDPRKPDREAIRAYFRKSEHDFKHLRYRVFFLDSAIRPEIEWAAYNARGMALMYRSDFPAEGEEGKRPAWLREALKALEHAEQVRPRDWANWCDLGSVHMRMAYYADDPGVSRAGYEEAQRRLEEVVKKLRPGYGFALYEIGRTHRLQGNPNEALRYFRQALEIPNEKRDVGDTRIKLEMERAERQVKAEGRAAKAEYP